MNLRRWFGPFLDFVFNSFRFEAAKFQVHAEMGVDGHVEVCHPDESEESDDVAAPILAKQLEAGECEKDGRYVMAEAILTSEKVEEFALNDVATALAATYAIVADFAQYLFVGNRPCDRRDGNGEDKQPDDLG